MHSSASAANAVHFAESISMLCFVHRDTPAKRESEKDEERYKEWQWGESEKERFIPPTRPPNHPTTQPIHPLYSISQFLARTIATFCQNFLLRRKKSSPLCPTPPKATPPRTYGPTRQLPLQLSALERDNCSVLQTGGVMYISQGKQFISCNISSERERSEWERRSLIAIR